MQDEIRLRLSSGRELRLYRDDCGRLMAQLSVHAAAASTAEAERGCARRTAAIAFG